MAVSGPKVVAEPSPRPKFRIGEVVGLMRGDGVCYRVGEIFSITTRYQATTEAPDGEWIYVYGVLGTAGVVQECYLTRMTSDLLSEKFGLPPFNTRRGGRLGEGEDS